MKILLIKTASFLLVYFCIQPFNYTLNAQKIYKLHPIIGDTIDRYEFNQYLLFTDYVNDSIDCYIIYTDNEQFTLIGYLNDEIQSKSLISKETIDENSVNVEKLYAYYNSLNEIDTIVIKNAELNDSLNVDLNINRAKLNKEIKIKKRQNFLRQSANEREERVKKGLFPH
nr:hypothetical protein [uncultured Carboxylicivirga sp.]